jgi:MoxR-like ATPase
VGILVNDKDLIRNIVQNIEKVILGKTSEIYDIMKGLIAGGHILIEDVPGVGKTTLVKALARSLNLSYSRIQFTPDLLPSDITGISIYNQVSAQFEFKKGPIFANIILADEINRTSPRTQSALLEVMEECQVSEGNITYILERPFMVLATQNPIEYEGTFTLPEAQLDRFLMKVRIGYVDKESESRILQIYGGNYKVKDIEPVAECNQILAMYENAMKVYVSKEITDYIVRIVNATRSSKYITLGASTRASIALVRVAKASALIDGRDYVIPQDVKRNAAAVLSHRLRLSSTARANNFTQETLLKGILDDTPLPVMVQHV